MNTQGNTYTVIYASVLVIVVAAGLSIASITLKPQQEKNVEIEKKQNILSSVQLGLDANQQSNKSKYIEYLYDKYIKETFIVNYKGIRVEGQAFAVDIKKETAKPIESRLLPVFVCTNDDSTKNYIFPVYGRGLWGPIWGYIALKDDLNTIKGAIFDHKGETPGLGAEINTPVFQSQFVGKQLFDNDKFVSVSVVKNQSTANNSHAVDAISGGTITSNGVSQMLGNCLNGYLEFLKTQKTMNHEQ